ncbi:MAG: DUF3866 family protein [Actinomyces sp.]|uniref:DUF3866 family protein n=1 Tax=Actinomyces sp. TaxID=29317 RepID=UPI0026DD50F3|nr:DUF3866 family protein [Actinomyces sp.]MDO4243304.1 DUF3866 family protein [Actinomyces sp.]
MMWRDGRVLALRVAWGREGDRCAELLVRILAAPANATGLLVGQECRAVVYETLTGMPSTGERVRLEVSALDRGLGTGGHAMVLTRLDVLPEDPTPTGHLVKARYMPDQVMVTGVDEQGTAHHGLLSASAEELTLGGVPVVVADLHSSLPAVLAGIRSSCSAAGRGWRGRKAPRVVYVMPDGGALPMPYSRTVAALRAAGWLEATVTAGQAWGGDVEAVSIHNALLAARHVLGAEVIVVIQGPGNLGTDTPWGFSGVACGDVVNAVAALQGRAVACLRISQTDPRERHRGVSHHSMTALGRVALAGADVVVPELPGELGRQVDRQAAALCSPRALGEPHRRIDVPVDGLRRALDAVEESTGLRLSTMGRGLDQDEAAFLAAAAAGRHAAALAAGLC